MKRFIFSIVLAMLSTFAQAGTIGLHVGSHHFPNAGMNNINPGAYYKADNGATAGGYLNSFDRVSLYAGVSLEAGPFALTVGGITGYQGHAKFGGYIAPLAVPSVALPFLTMNGVTPRLAYVPKVEKAGAHVIHLMLEF